MAVVSASQVGREWLMAGQHGVIKVTKRALTTTAMAAMSPHRLLDKVEAARTLG